MKLTGGEARTLLEIIGQLAKHEREDAIGAICKFSRDHVDEGLLLSKLRDISESEPYVPPKREPGFLFKPRRFEYKVETHERSSLEKNLNIRALEGWRLVLIGPAIHNRTDVINTRYDVIWERPFS